MSTSAMESVTVNITYISYYSDEDEESGLMYVAVE